MSVKIIEMFIPKSNKFTRPGRKMTPTSITIHETDNNNVRANALAHAKLQQNGNARQASWHLTVDDEVEVYQSLPFDEVGYHAGDAKGNNSSIGIEVCVNVDGDFKKAVEHAIEVAKYLIKKYPTITTVNVVQHNYWSGKHCPRKIREGYKGITWNFVKKGITGGKVTAIKPPKAPEYNTSNNSVKKGEKVILKSSATHYSTGEAIAKKYRNKEYTVKQYGSNRVLLSELNSWVKIGDIKSKGSSSGNYTQDAKYPKKGNYGSNVLKIQKLLNKAGYMVNEDSSFGPKTDKAVRRFQKDHGLAVDGQAGPKTQKALNSSSVKKTSNKLAVDGSWGKATTRALQKHFGTAQDGIISGQPKNRSTKNIPSAKYGTVGSNLIRAMQRHYKSGIVDGKISGTSNLIKAMQRKYNLSIVDGYVSLPSNLVKEIQRRLNNGTL